MKYKTLISTFFTSLLLLPSMVCAQQSDKIVIAHRGASGYLPEHTIAAKAMAYAMGADYLEQDVVMTKDDRLVVLHDHYLDHVSDVQEKFPTRMRDNGRYYVIDFTLEEIRTLEIVERYDIIDGKKTAVFPKRFPLGKSRFKIHTFSEEIELIQGLNKSTGHNIGIYPEVKSPEFHRQQGKDLSLSVLKVLKKYGYISKQDKVYFQTFDIEELKRVHDILLPELSMNIKLIQLLDIEDYYDQIITKDGLSALGKYADGIGPYMKMIASNDKDGLHITDLVKNAHAAGLDVHPYTFRQDQIEGNYEEVLDLFLYQIGVDGVFTDFTDRTVNFIKNKK